MMAARCVVATILAAAALASCSTEQPSRAIVAETGGTTDEPILESTATTTTGDTARPMGDWVQLDAGRWDGEPQVDVLRDHLGGFVESMHTRAITPELLLSTTFSLVQQLRTKIGQAMDDGRSVSAPAIGYVADLQQQGADATVSICLWRPSVALVDEETEQPVGQVREAWTPRDVRMAQANNSDGELQWYVMSDQQGSIRCDREAP